VQAEKPEAEQRNLLVAAALNGSEKKLYELLNTEEPLVIDDIVERRLELFRSSGYPLYSGDERHHPAVAREAVQQSLAVEADRGSRR